LWTIAGAERRAARKVDRCSGEEHVQVVVAAADVAGGPEALPPDECREAGFHSAAVGSVFMLKFVGLLSLACCLRFPVVWAEA
jgi:hypothetical protein